MRQITTNQAFNGKETTQTRKRISILGAGSWGTAIADLIGHNVIKNPHLFHEEVILYVRDDKLRLIIEKTRQNIRYLSAIKLPMNVRPVSSLSEALSQTDIIIFVIPHEYIRDLCFAINNRCISTRDPIGISLIKGLHVDSAGNLERTSEIIERMLQIEVGVLSGANIAIEVARKEYSEATLSPPNVESEQMLCSLFESDYFKVSVCNDKPTVEMCGALKNVVACGAGLIDGLGFGINTKAAAITCGLKETIRFVQIFHPNYRLSTFLENCGIADTIASSFSGRNRKVTEALIKSNKSLHILEKQLLGGQKLQGPNTAHVVYQVLSQKQLLEEFPFFAAVHNICNRSMNPKDLISAIKSSH